MARRKEETHEVLRTVYDVNFRVEVCSIADDATLQVKGRAGDQNLTLMIIGGPSDVEGDGTSGINVSCAQLEWLLSNVKTAINARLTPEKIRTCQASRMGGSTT